MPPTRKRQRSPEVDESLSASQSTSVQIHQDAPPKKRRWRGLKDHRYKSLRKLESKRSSQVLLDTSSKPITTPGHQIDTHVRHAAPASVEYPLQHNARLSAPHSPCSLPEEGDNGGLEIFNGSPVSPHVPFGSDLCAAPIARDNRALFRQTRHLDDHTPAWNQRRNKQATQWQSVVIPQLIPIYLTNRAVTKSGKLPPPPPSNHPCECKKVALKVEMVTWDRKYSLSCSNCLPIMFYIRILVNDIGYLRMLFSCSTVGPNGLLPLCPCPPNSCLRYQPT